MPASTWYVPKFNRSNIFPTVNRPSDSLVLDCLDQVILDLVKSIKSYSEVTFVEGKTFTTLVWEVYRTTTIEWFIVYYNGFYHPFDLQPGMVIKFPTLSDIEIGLITKNTPGNALVVI